MARKKSKSWGRNALQQSHQKRKKAERRAAQALAEKQAAYATLDELKRQYGDDPEAILLGLAQRFEDLQALERWLNAESKILEQEWLEMAHRAGELIAGEVDLQDSVERHSEMVSAWTALQHQELSALEQRKQALADKEEKYGDIDKSTYIKKLERRLARKSDELQKAREQNSRLISQEGLLLSPEDVQA